MAGFGAGGNLVVSPGAAAIDTNCTGCNATNTAGGVVERFAATLDGAAAGVKWSLAGGDANAGAGVIDANGAYTPPGYLTADSARVIVTASLASNPSLAASTTILLRPGFRQPLTPENVALGAGASATITSYLAEAGGAAGVRFALADSPTGSNGGQGTLSDAGCTRSSRAFTVCTVRYTAPASMATTSATYVVATADGTGAKQAAAVLLNAQGVASNPVEHQRQMATPVLLGGSGGNNNDYDTKSDRVEDCCGGTLGSLIQNSSGRQYLLSCNHVLAGSDQASVGETIVQPALIDNNCTPSGEGAGIAPVGALTAWLPLGSSATNADAAIAQVDSNAVNANGAILELGAAANGTLAAAPPGVSSTGGRGETGALNLTVAKSGRTTGLTCGHIAAMRLTVKVDYFKDCAETVPYRTKIFTNQLGIEGKGFGDAGDSGALVVDASNAEPVGLFFAGGLADSGLSEVVATPAPEVLAELGRQEATSYSFVGAADHPVRCLDYGAGAATAAQSLASSATPSEQRQRALEQARQRINSARGILSVAEGESSDRPGEAAVIFYVDASKNAHVPQTLDGVRTVVVSITAQAIQAGATPAQAASTVQTPLTSSVFNQAAAVKDRIAWRLMEQNPGFFGVGVGQSLDNPREAALVVYVDRNQIPAALPPIIDGLRTRYVVMSRLHVTRSYLQGAMRATGRCLAHPAVSADKAWFLRRPLLP